MSKICSECGQELPDNAILCILCSGGQFTQIGNGISSSSNESGSFHVPPVEPIHDPPQSFQASMHYTPPLLNIPSFSSQSTNTFTSQNLVTDVLCEKCGEKPEPGEVFCVNCGSIIKNNT